MARHPRSPSLIVFVLIVLAGCTGPEVLFTDDYDESTTAVTPAPIPASDQNDLPEPHFEHNDLDLFPIPPEQVARQHTESLAESYTVHERQTLTTETGEILREHTIEYRVNHSTNTRYLNISTRGTFVAESFNASPITEETWYLPTQTIQVRTINNETDVKLAPTPVSAVAMTSPRTAYWSEIAASGQTPSHDIQQLFDTYNFVITSEIRMHQIVDYDDHPVIHEYQLSATNTSDPTWLLGTADRTKLRSAAATAEIHHTGTVAEYELVFWADKPFGITQTQRLVQYENINATAIPPQPQTS